MSRESSLAHAPSRSRPAARDATSHAYRRSSSWAQAVAVAWFGKLLKTVRSSSEGVAIRRSLARETARVREDESFDTEASAPKARLVFYGCRRSLARPELISDVRGERRTTSRDACGAASDVPRPRHLRRRTLASAK